LLSVDGVLQKVLANLNTAIEESGAVVTYSGLPEVMIEEVLLLRLFQNLISNSLKYRGAAAPRIHVSSEEISGEYLFSVADNGVGIAPEYREKVFQMFKRLHGRDFPGVGMGLALCRKAVERKGGRIWVEDTKSGCGAAFKFTLRERG